ncbi:2612_t:CDS:2, partial [Scutellospora calospora]
AFVRNGARVYIASRKKKILDIAAAELNALGPGECYAIEANLNSKEACEKLATEIGAREKGKLDILVNNAGTVFDATLFDFPEKEWDNIYNLNVKSYIRCLPLLEKASHKPDDPSRVIIVGSISGEGDLRGIVEVKRITSIVYNSSKAAVHNIAKNLAVHFTPRGVNVNVIAPGVIFTEMTSNKDISSCISEVPQGRLGVESDIAGSALFLASHAGSWVSGIIMPVDGGTLLRNKDLGMKMAKL